MAFFCGQCGQEVWSQGLCPSCERSRDEITNNSRRAADAAERQLEVTEARQREERELAVREGIAALVTFAKDIDSILPSKGVTLKDVWGTLVQIKGITGNIDKWAALMSVDPHGVEFAYPILRRRIVPYIVALSRIKDQNVPKQLLKDYAVTFLYPDLKSSVDIYNRVESLESKYQSERSDSADLQGKKQESQKQATGCTGGCLFSTAGLIWLMLQFKDTPSVHVTIAIICGAAVSFAILFKNLNAAKKHQNESLACNRNAQKNKKLWEEGKKLLAETADKDLQGMIATL